MRPQHPSRPGSSPSTGLGATGKLPVRAWHARRTVWLASLAGLTTVLVAFWMPRHVVAQQAAAPAATTGASTVASPPPVKRMAKAAPAAPAPAVSGPVWANLNEPQKRALQPLAARWDSLSDGQKRKWLAVSQNFAKMPPAEQAKLHSRMADWVTLTASERSQARLNFNEAKKITPAQRQSQWEAYQALSPEERRKLAESARQLKSTAPAIHPTPQKLAVLPPQTGGSVRILPQPQLDQNTLLPQWPAAGASASTVSNDAPAVAIPASNP